MLSKAFYFYLQYQFHIKDYTGILLRTVHFPLTIWEQDVNMSLSLLKLSCCLSFSHLLNVMFQPLIEKWATEPLGSLEMSNKSGIFSLRWTLPHQESLQKSVNCPLPTHISLPFKYTSFTFRRSFQTGEFIDFVCS